MRTKKSLFLFSLLIFAGMLIVGCGSSGETSNGDDGSEEATPISISMRTGALPYVENHSNINDDEYVKKLEELTNTDLDIRLMPHSDFSTQMDLMFASGDLPDVVAARINTGTSLRQALEAGVFLPLDDLIEEHGPNLKEFIPEDIWDEVRYKDGNIYSIPKFLSNPSRRATYIRKDLLDQTGLDAPTTIDEMLDVLRAFKELGVEQPFAARANLHYADTVFGAYDVQHFWEINESGELIPKFFDSENMKEAISVYKTMYDEGLIHPEFLTQDATDFRNLIQAGNAGMWSMDAGQLIAWEENLVANVLDAEIEIIPSPIGPDGNGGYQLYQPIERDYFINKDAENPEKIIQFFDWMVTEEAETFFTYGIEGEDYTVENGEINYQQPETTDEQDREFYRSSWLWMVKDGVYTEGLLELTPEGEKLIEIFDTILLNEGRSGIRFDPPLESYMSYPALQEGNSHHSEFIMEYIAKMITGAEPIEKWDEVIEEWKDVGGDVILEEANARYDAGEYSEPIEPPK